MNAQSDDLQERFRQLQVWSRGGRRAAHKPLLALWAIGRCLQEKPRMARYDFVDREIARLLRKFRPSPQRATALWPFWNMRKDGVWEVGREHLVSVGPSGKARERSLLEHNIHGGLRQEDYSTLRKNPDLAVRIARSLLSEHFPEVHHAAILRETGIRNGLPAESAQRGERFRAAVLDAYEHRCAVCRFGVRLKNDAPALDAVYIQWPQAHGPEEVQNGLALCALHHRLFDDGLFTLLADFRVRADPSAGGADGKQWIGRFDGKRLKKLPRDAGRRPQPEFLQWHNRVVFRTPSAAR